MPKKARPTRKFTEKQVAKLYKIYKSQFGAPSQKNETVMDIIDRLERAQRLRDRMLQSSIERAEGVVARQNAESITNKVSPQPEKVSEKARVARANIFPGLSGTTQGGQRIPQDVIKNIADLAKGNFLSHDPEKPLALIGKRVVIRMVNRDWPGTVTHYDGIDKTHRIMFDDFDAKSGHVASRRGVIWRDLRELGGKDGQGIWDEGQWTPPRNTHKEARWATGSDGRGLCCTDKEIYLRQIQSIFVWMNIYTDYTEWTQKPWRRQAPRDAILNGWSLRGNGMCDPQTRSSLVEDGGPAHWLLGTFEEWQAAPRHERGIGTDFEPDERWPGVSGLQLESTLEKAKDICRAALRQGYLKQYVLNSVIEPAGLSNDAQDDSKGLFRLIGMKTILGDKFSREAEELFNMWAKKRGYRALEFIDTTISKLRHEIEDLLEKRNLGARVLSGRIPGARI